MLEAAGKATACPAGSRRFPGDALAQRRGWLVCCGAAGTWPLASGILLQRKPGTAGAADSALPGTDTFCTESEPRLSLGPAGRLPATFSVPELLLQTLS